MKRINNLRQTALVVLATFGLSGCGSDNPSGGKPTGAAPWGLGEMSVVREVNGETVALKETDATAMTYNWSDRIEFKDYRSNWEESISLNINTECFLGTQRFAPHKIQMPMKSSIAILELLPTSVIASWFASATNPVHCEFKFFATHVSGSTHSFRLKPAATLPQSVKSPIAINKNQIRLTSNDEDLFTVELENLLQYTLPSLQSSDTRYQIQCENTMAMVNYQSGPVRLDQFEFSRLTEKNWPVENCYLFLLGPGDRVLNISEKFVLKNITEKPRVQSLLPWKQFVPFGEGHENVEYIEQHFVFSEFLISNPTDKEMVLALNDAPYFVKVTPITVVNEGVKKIIGTDYYLPLTTNVQGMTHYQRENYHSRFVLSPKASMKLKLLVPFRNLKCPGTNLRSAVFPNRQNNRVGGPAIGGVNLAYNAGFRYSYMSEEGLVLHHLVDIEKPLISENMISTTELEPAEMRYFDLIDFTDDHESRQFNLIPEPSEMRAEYCQIK